MLVNFECVSRMNSQTGLNEGGFVIARKITHPSVAKLLPNENEQIGIKFGEALAAWCASAGQPTVKESLTTRSKDELKKELWNLTKLKHGGEPAKLEQWLWDEMLLDPALKLADLDTPTMAAIIKLAKGKL